MNKQHLIALVKSHRELYDSSHPKYSDSFRRDQLWNDIGKQFNDTAENVKKVWTHLRDAYRRSIRRQKDISGHMKGYRFSNEMSFLNNYMHEISDIVAAKSDPTTNNDESMSNDNSEDKDHPYSRIEQSADDPKPQSLLTFLRDSESDDPLQRISKKRKCDPDPSPSDQLCMAMTKHLESKIAQDAALKSENDIDAFLHGMSATLKKFSKYNQAVAKKRIFAIVSEIEIQEILETEPHLKDSAGLSCSENEIFEIHHM